MSTANVNRIHRRESGREGEVDDEIRHISDLIVVRHLLAARGATTSELQEYDAVIECARGRLAESAKRTSARYARAA
jgi:hypothetical protein